ncbi:MAG TPA: GGDEF domain-containing protein [Actinomycetota bacterium]|nr:GGDEF domain-containing protein [Actinomycetota bacterium]
MGVIPEAVVRVPLTPPPDPAAPKAWAAVVHKMRIGVQVWQLDEGHFTILSLNPAGELLLGVSPENVAGMRVEDCFPWTGEMGVTSVAARVLRSDVPELLDDIEVRTPHGPLCLSVEVFPLPDQCIGVAFADVTERERRESRLRREALHDPLTGVANRRLLAERIEEAFAAPSRPGRYVAMVVLDLDDFKSVNDRHGHSGGDILLQQVALRLLDLTRSTDTVARLGGDEFAILAPTVVGLRGARRLAARVGEAFDIPFDVNGRVTRVSASIGVAARLPQSPAVPPLVDVADRAMYAQKRRRGGRSGPTPADIAAARQGA